MLTDSQLVWTLAFASVGAVCLTIGLWHTYKPKKRNKVKVSDSYDADRRGMSYVLSNGVCVCTRRRVIKTPASPEKG